MTGVQRQAADLLQRLKKIDFSLAKKKGQHLEIGELEIIQMALEKQVPGKPAEYTKWTNNVCILKNKACSRCSHDVEKAMKYCPECGQAIDWRGI